MAKTTKIIALFSNDDFVASQAKAGELRASYANAKPQ
jgi:hypothetical protein